MAETDLQTAPVDPATEEFVADRRKFWSSFTGFTTFAVIVVIVILVAMLVFLV